MEISILEEWDFYLCKVDDAPASIFLNLGFRNSAPITSADHRYSCQIEILDPGEHGMGIGTDALALQELEDAIVEEAQKAGFFFVARLRNHARWQLTFYGSEKLDSTLRSLVSEILLASAERQYDIASKPDADWSYYFDFLFPDAERWQWILNRRVVEQLEAEGDSLSEARRVDHWAYFDSVAARDEFVEVVRNHGFEIERIADDVEGDHPFSAQVYRHDSVQLHFIHDVVMSLKQTAEELGGNYDGWETSVEKP